MTEYLAVIKAYNTHKGIRFYHTSSSYNSSGDSGQLTENSTVSFCPILIMPQKKKQQQKKHSTANVWHVLEMLVDHMLTDFFLFIEHRFTLNGSLAAMLSRLWRINSAPLPTGEIKQTLKSQTMMPSVNYFHLNAKQKKATKDNC